MNEQKEKPKQNVLANWLLLGFSCLFAFVIGECGARQAFKGSNLGWAFEKPLPERIDECQRKNGNVAIFGDSFVEYFRGTADNMTQVVESLHPQLRTCNFGFSGTGIDDYLVKFEKVSQDANIQKAVFVLFTGNDYDDYFLRFLEGKIANQDTTKVLPVQGLLHDTKNRSSIFNLLKQSVLFNVLWRFGFKQFFPQRDFSSTTLQKDVYYGPKFNLDPATIEKRMSQIPQDIVKAAQADLVNVHILKRAVFDPLFFQRIHQGYGEWNAGVITQVQDRIKKINDICIAKKISCFFTFIALDVFTDTHHHSFYKRLGYALSPQNIGQAKISLQIQGFLKEQKIPYQTSLKELQKDTTYFLPQDGHLSLKGHKRLGRIIAEQLKAAH